MSRSSRCSKCKRMTTTILIGNQNQLMLGQVSIPMRSHRRRTCLIHMFDRLPDEQTQRRNQYVGQHIRFEGSVRQGAASTVDAKIACCQRRKLRARGTCYNVRNTLAVLTEELNRGEILRFSKSVLGRQRSKSARSCCEI